MRVKLSEKCKEEREEICDKIISILDLDNDTEKQTAILNMKEQIQKYCNCFGDLEYYKNKQQKRISSFGLL